MAYHLRNKIIYHMPYHNHIIYAIDDKREAPEGLKRKQKLTRELGGENKMCLERSPNHRVFQD